MEKLRKLSGATQMPAVLIVKLKYIFTSLMYPTYDYWLYK